MSAPPGAFENSGGAVNQQTQNGTGPPNKRPKMDDQNKDQNASGQMGNNPLDNIFGPDSGGGGMLSDDLMKNAQQQQQQMPPVSQQKQGMPTNMGNGATQLQQVSRSAICHLMFISPIQLGVGYLQHFRRKK